MKGTFTGHCETSRRFVDRSNARLRVTDTAGVVAVCRAGLEAGAEAGGAMEAAVASVSVVLLLVILGSLATLILVRRRRKAQLENMRQLPS